MTGWVVAPGDVDSQFVVAAELTDPHGAGVTAYFTIEDARAFVRDFVDAIRQAEYYEANRPWENN